MSTETNRQIDAGKVIDQLTLEVATAVRRAVIAEQHAAALEEEIVALKEGK